MKKAPRTLPLGEFSVSFDKGEYPALPRFSVHLRRDLGLWERIVLAALLIFNPKGLSHRFTYDEVLVLSNMVEVYGLIRALRMIKRRHRGSY